jgi:Uma2 family endonuclease
MRRRATDLTIPVPRLPSGISSAPIWRMSVQNYHKLLDAGIVTEDEPLELLRGWLVPKMKKSPLHVYVASQLDDCLRSLLPEGWWIDRQHPITMADSEPEPDLAVVRGDFREYSDQHPTPADAAIVMEVAHSTLEIDRGLKLQVYASAGIAEYWIVNIPERCIEVYTKPIGSPVAVGVPHEIETKEGYPLVGETVAAARYQHRRDYVRGQRVPLSLRRKPLGEVAVADVFPQSKTTPSP